MHTGPSGYISPRYAYTSVYACVDSHRVAWAACGKRLPVLGTVAAAVPIEVAVAARGLAFTDRERLDIDRIELLSEVGLAVGDAEITMLAPVTAPAIRDEPVCSV